MGIRKYKPTTPGRRGASVLGLRRDHAQRAGEVAAVRPLHSKGGRNVHGRVTARHQGGGHKRAYRIIDFRRAGQGRRSGQGRAHRVRPEPDRPYRAAALRRRREALHPRARAASSRATRSRTAPAPTSSRATACRCATSRPVPSSTRWSCARAAAPRSAVPPARSVQLLAKEGRYATLRMPSGEIRAGRRRAAGPPSARSATPSRRTSTGARPAACGGRASARPSAVSR